MMNINEIVGMIGGIAGISAVAGTVGYKIGHRIGKKKEHYKMQDKIEDLRRRYSMDEFTSIPHSAADDIRRLLTDDEAVKVENKPFKYEALVTVMDGKMKIEDYQLTVVKTGAKKYLTEFNRDNRFVDNFLMDSEIIEAIASKLRCKMIDDLSINPKFDTMFNRLAEHDEYEDKFILDIRLGFAEIKCIANLDCLDSMEISNRKIVKERQRQNKKNEIHNEYVKETDKFIEDFHEAFDRMAGIEKRVLLLRNLAEHFNDPDFPKLRNNKPVPVADETPRVIEIEVPRSSSEKEKETDGLDFFDAEIVSEEKNEDTEERIKEKIEALHSEEEVSEKEISEERNEDREKRIDEAKNSYSLKTKDKYLKSYAGEYKKMSLKERIQHRIFKKNNF